MTRWWADAVIYQVYPRSFADANGDGLGDLDGIRSRIGYLAELGVDAVWLSPFYKSPMNDAGYDVADFRDVDPRFGTLEDFDALVDEAHARGMRVIIDIVPNHSSDQHPWFQEALAAKPGSAARRRYHFADSGTGPPNDWQSVFGGPAWTQLPDGQWYLHLFDSSQPDFNWDHPDVRAEFDDILRFWLDRGVDGFRIDVAHGLMKEAGLPDIHASVAMAESGNTRVPYFDVDAVHEIYRDWRKILDSYDGDRMAVAEAWVGSPQRRANYVRHDELHQAFNFDLLMAEFDAADYRRVIDAEIAMAGSIGASATWVLSNHDRYRPVTRFGDGQLGLARARAAGLLMLALPGSAYIYQGEELGLPEVLDLPDEMRQDPTWERSGHTDKGRDGCRVPIPWTTDGPSFGFGDTQGWLPQPADWGRRSVAAQRDDPSSTLQLYRRALAERKRHPATGLTWLDEPDAAQVLAFTNGSLRCVTNFSDTAIPLSGEVLVCSGEHVDGVLAPNTTAWLTNQD